jgi:XTP/dITP diphosphohydrolase
MKIVLASSNKGKIKEFQELLNPFQLEVIPQADLGVEDIPETGLSFIENAIIKARHAAQVTGLPALADDSGLAVDALQGAPGIYSARYAGEHANSKNNIEKLLKEMHGIPDEKRSAHFHCVLVFMSHALDPRPLVCDGKWSGKILHAPQGEQGFGYDPIFYLPLEKASAAQLSAELKNKISHRGQAMQALLKVLLKRLSDKL